MKHPSSKFKLYVSTVQGNYNAYFVSLESAYVATATLKNSVVIFWVIRDLRDNQIIANFDSEKGAKK